MAVDSVPLRKLGKNGPSVPALGFGLMVLAGAYGTPPSDEEQFRILDRAVDLGETFWDTSDMYGDNEVMLGKWFKRTGKRHEIFLASKFGIKMEDRQFKGIVSSGEYCKQACQASLKKLGIDCIDLYYAHRVNLETSIEETMRALAELKAEGKIRHIGLCGVSSNAPRRAYKIAPVAAVQVEHSPFALDIEGPSESVTGAGDHRVKEFPRFSEENIEANLKLVGQFKTFVDQKGCTPSQLAIAWLLKQGDDIVPIPGTKSIKYLEENWSAIDIHLTDDEQGSIRKFVESAEIAGPRDTPAGKPYAFADPKEA